MHSEKSRPGQLSVEECAFDVPHDCVQGVVRSYAGAILVAVVHSLVFTEDRQELLTAERRGHLFRTLSEQQLDRGVGQIHREVTSGLGGPRPGWMRSPPSDVPGGSRV